MTAPTHLGMQALFNQDTNTKSAARYTPMNFSLEIQQNNPCDWLSNQGQGIVSYHPGNTTASTGHAITMTDEETLNQKTDEEPLLCISESLKNANQEDCQRPVLGNGTSLCSVNTSKVTLPVTKPRKRPKKPSLRAALLSVLSQQQLLDSSEKQHQCPDCPKKFSWHFQLQQHSRIHTGERPFVCNECNQAYKRRDHLIRHERIHTGERPFPCQECGKRYRRKTQLARHRLVHTGERPHHCELCGKAYRRRGHLLRHMKLHQNADFLAEDSEMPEADGACHGDVHSVMQSEEKIGED